ncbi:MAG: hypothetical protein ING59_19710 [Burkholderiales bacterium]|jgi:hypothetical protein|nr:hypothetical protein [Burkholderiales bacterium]
MPSVALYRPRSSTAAVHAAVLAALGALLAALLLGPPPARGIEPQPVEIILAQRPVMLDLYPPTGDAPPRGAVVLAHGFTRTRATMAEHPAALAALGLIAAVPELPYVTDSRANARVLADLVQWLRAGTQTPASIRGPARIFSIEDTRQNWIFDRMKKVEPDPISFSCTSILRRC